MFLQEGRPFEGLTAAATGLGPFQPGFKVRPEHLPELVAAEAAAARNSRDPRAGVLPALAWGKADTAVALLQEAAKLHPEDPTLQVDLACALLFRARLTGRGADLAGALEAADLALQRAPDLHAAAYNRALALERLHLVKPAAQAWAALANDPSPHTAAASVHLEALQQRLAAPTGETLAAALGKALDAENQAEAAALAASFPQETRTWMEATLLGPWARMVCDGADPSDVANRLVRVASLPGFRTRETAVAEQLAWAASAPRKDLLSLGKALLDLAAAEHLYESQELAACARRVDEALPFLEQLQSPFRYQARYRAAVCRYHRGENRRVIADTAALLHAMETSGQTALTGRIYWLKNLAHSRLEENDQSFACLERAARLFRAGGERGNLGAVRNMTAQNHDDLGNLDAAWEARMEALALQADMDPRRLCNLLYVTCMGMLHMGTPHAALEVARHLTATADAAKSPLLQAFAYRRRARVFLVLQQFGEAAGDLDAARLHAAAIPDAATREGVDRDIDLTAATLYGHTNPEAALPLLTRVEALSHKRESAHLLMEIAAVRLRALSALQRDAEAAEAFEAGVSVYETLRVRTASGPDRLMFQEAATRFFDQWIGYRGAAIDGLAAVDRHRARALLDALGQAPATPAHLSAALNPDREALVYHVRDDAVYAWRVTPTGITAHRLTPGGPELARRIYAWTHALRTALAEEPTQAEELFTLLVAPMFRAEALPARLVIVPHGCLWDLPFDFLVDPHTGRRLVETHQTLTSPSLSAFAALHRVLPNTPPRAVAFAVSQARPDYLGEPLTHALAEAREAAACYEGEVLTGEHVTSQAFQSAVSHADILHFAGHAVRGAGPVDLLLSGGPWNTALLPTAGSPPESAPELVVLSACSTAAGSPRAGEGPYSAAMPFLNMGTPAVVATRWPVDDGETRTLMRLFHRAYRKHRDAVHALNLALCESAALQPPLSPTTRAAFFVTGGATERRPP